MRSWVADFTAHASKHPGDLCAVGADGGLTAGELHGRARQIAAALTAARVAAGSVVGTYMQRGPDLLAAQLGIWLHGSCVLSMDPAQPALRLAHMVRDAGPRGVIVDGSDLPGPVRDAAGDCQWIEAGGHPARDEGPTGPAADLACILYTSGSTGTPKGVAVKHSSLVGMGDWYAGYLELKPGEHVSSLAAVTFDAFYMETWPALISGAVVIFAPLAVRESTTSLVSWLRDAEITGAFLPTAIAQRYIKEGADFGRLRYVITGGEQLRLDDGHPLRRLVNAYGLTETTVLATACEVPASICGAPPIGTPVAGVKTLLMNNAGRKCRPGEPGELFIGGPCLAQGYWNNPVATSARFVDVPDHGGPWFRTGDLSVADEDGSLHFLGRADRQVKVRGIRVEPSEVEQVLCQHPAVGQAFAFLTDEKLLGAAVAVRAGYDPAESELASFVAERLPEFMVPAVFLVLAELPLTVHGKVDASALGRKAALALARQHAASTRVW